jgi:bifunctional ADP-heptose synthase (sugar kinase/adenylyltransferase)
MKTQIVVMGDPIKDRYFFCEPVYNEHGEPIYRKTSIPMSSPGGAANVLAHLRTLSKNHEDIVVDQYMPVQWQPNIDRYIDSQNQIVFTFTEIKSGRDREVFSDLDLPRFFEWNDHHEAILIASDYGLGFLKSPSATSFFESGKPNLMIVDSKYRTFDLRNLSHADNTIWRCTGSEYSKEWGKYFDCIIQTSGSDDVCFYRRGQLMATFPVKQGLLVDPLGAGDVFNAALATSIAIQNKPIFNYNLVDILLQAIPKAIEITQEIILTPKYNQHR